jgi:hypothetical protein
MSTIDGSSTTQLTPALGALLHNYRTESGESAKTVSRRCSLGVVEIAQVELGRADLDVDRLADAIDAYAVARVVFPEGHCQVHVDLVAGTVSVLSADIAVEETPADRILLAYFEMVFAAHPMSPATPIPFTDLDLDVLRIVLSSRRNEVTEHLHRMVGPLDEPLELVSPTRRTARSALVLLAAAATTAAIIVLPYVASSDSPAVAPIEVQIAEAVVITR